MSQTELRTHFQAELLTPFSRDVPAGAAAVGREGPGHDRQTAADAMSQEELRTHVPHDRRTGADAMSQEELQSHFSHDCRTGADAMSQKELQTHLSHDRPAGG